MNFVSCFSGIEAASASWLPLGFCCVAVSEVEPAACAVLSQRYPESVNLGDVLADDFLDRVATISPGVIVGGPPCQDFSVAGLRAGLNGHRGNLTLRWVQIIHASNARFAVTENVPGWLSANNGHAFGAFLAGLVGHDTDLLPPKDCGGRWTNAGMVAGPNGRAAWRILDAQYFGLAQRRKRVFVVFCPGNDHDPAQILFERKGLCRDTPPRRETRQRIAASLTRGADSGGGFGTDFDCDGGLLADTVRSHPRPGSNSVGNIAFALNAHGGSGRLDGESETFVCETADSQTVGANQTYGFVGDIMAHSLRAEGFDASEDGTGRGTPLIFVDLQNCTVGGDLAGTLDTTRPTRGGGQATMAGSAVRRLTPLECLRLQGFPDDFFDGILYRGKPLSDGVKYRLLGNSMAVPCMSWIGSRIVRVDMDGGPEIRVPTYGVTPEGRAVIAAMEGPHDC